MSRHRKFYAWTMYLIIVIIVCILLTVQSLSFLSYKLHAYIMLYVFYDLQISLSFIECLYSK